MTQRFPQIRNLPNLFTAPARMRERLFEDNLGINVCWVSFNMKCSSIEETYMDDFIISRALNKQRMGDNTTNRSQNNVSNMAQERFYDPKAIK
jgi:hypothetical protein